MGSSSEIASPAEGHSPLGNFISSTFELSTSSENRLLPMEGLRGIAAYLVFLVHYATLIEPWIEPNATTAIISQFLFNVGHAGVDLFFVLSGYLIYGSLIRKKQPYVAFMWRRLRRLYPVFLVVLSTYLLLFFALPSLSKLPSDSIEALRMVVSNVLLLPGVFDLPIIITVAWSLSYELSFYLTVPLLVAVLRLRNWSPYARIALCMCLIPLPAALEVSIRASMFVAGMLLFETLLLLKDKHADQGWLSLMAGSTFPLGLGYIGYARFQAENVSVSDGIMISQGPWITVILFITSYLLCLAAFHGPGLVARVFSWTPIRLMGNISYSFYLVHGLALQALFQILGMIIPPAAGSTVLFWLLLPVATLTALLSSSILFILVERPYSMDGYKALSLSKMRNWRQ